MVPNCHMQAGAGPTAALARQLKHPPGELHGVVLAHHVRLFVTQKLLDISPAERDEGRGGVRRGTAERRVVIGQELLPQIGVGRRKRRDLRDAEFVDQAILKRAIQPLWPRACGEYAGIWSTPRRCRARPTWVSSRRLTGPFACGIWKALCARSV
jgi:hypothetical protein